MWNKYGNRKVTNDEGTFDSVGEWRRWCFLKDAQIRGEIHGLRRQVTYKLVPPLRYFKKVHLKTKDKLVERVWTREVTYTADFVYEYMGETIVEDFKGMPNDRWQMKKALMAFIHNIYVREVKRPNEPLNNQVQ